MSLQPIPQPWHSTTGVYHASPLLATRALSRLHSLSTDEVFHLRDDLETAGLTFPQNMKDIKFAIQHPFMVEHNLQ